ncbi:MAG: hypothetical protein RIR00_1530 [Pseudomonadota bacterium]
MLRSAALHPFRPLRRLRNLSLLLLLPGLTACGMLPFDDDEPANLDMATGESRPAPASAPPAAPRPSPAASLPAAAGVAAASCPACPVCACPPPVAPPVPVATARTLQPVSWSELPGWRDDEVRAAWPAFLQSCKGLTSKNGAGWKRVCDLAGKARGDDNGTVRAFFQQHFQPHALIAGDGKNSGLITGYYEPLLKGSRQPSALHTTPALAVPDDLLTIDLGELYPELKDKRVRGRLVGNKVVPYWPRADIVNQSDRGRPLVWLEDPVEFFFLQIQGSGRVRLPDGGILRLGYADQNGHPYQSIGRILIERGELRPEEASMQGIQAWARANPARLNELLNSNPSYVFFRELPANNDGPIGALGVPLTPERSLAVDPRSIPLGAPVFLATTRPLSSEPLNRLMLAQDTGGAIKGAIRADFFWGFGKEAGEQAGRMKQPGRMWVLLPPEVAPR